MERDLLSRITGNAGVRQQQRLQGQDPTPPPSPALNLHLGSQQAPQSQADATIRGHALAPQQQPHHHAPSPPPASLPTSSSSRAPFIASDRLASVVVPGYPMSQRRHNLRVGARAQPGPTRAPPVRPTPTAAQVPTTLQLAGPTGSGEERRCDACGLSAKLLRGLSSDLDRARAQVALLTCQNESLRSRLKRAAAAAVAPELMMGPPASSAHLSLRCGACRVRPATVVLVPREHLCLCGRCCSDAAVACSVCHAAAEGTGPAMAAPAPEASFLKGT